MSKPTNLKTPTERLGDNDSSRQLQKDTIKLRKSTALATTKVTIVDAATARSRFERAGYLVKDQLITVGILATIARQLTLEASNDSRSTGLSALAFLLEE